MLFARLIVLAAASTSVVALQLASDGAKADAPRRNRTENMPYDAARMCSFEACMFHKKNAPRLFIPEHRDGAGHRLKNVIDGMAIAHKNKMNFGGMYTNIHEHLTEHGVNFTNLLGRFFGKELYDPQEFFFDSPPAYAARFSPNLTLFTNGSKKLSKLSRVYLPSTNVLYKFDASEYYTDKFRRVLEKPLQKLPLKFEPYKVAVAIHLRRGDLPRSEGRITPDEYYYSLVERIRRRFPNATDVHVWSSTGPGSGQHGKRYWWSKDFDGYRARGMRVHLDDTDLMDPWAHLARARILLMGQSSFSYIPAVINRHCVIHPGHTAATLGNWMDGSNNRRASYDDEFELCMARAIRRQGPKRHRKWNGRKVFPSWRVSHHAKH